MTADRQRVAALIVSEGRVLMVRERNRDAQGRHRGAEIWTLPGGGVDEGESLEDAVRREVAEEVGLRATSVRHLFDYPYQSGFTACFAVEVEPGDPVLGTDESLECDCPRMVGLAWMPLGDDPGAETGTAVPLAFTAVAMGNGGGTG